MAKEIAAREREMTNSNRAGGWLCAVAAAALLAVSAAIPPTADIQDAGVQVNTGAAQSVDLRTAPALPSVPRPEGLAINRPTIPMADYVAAKNAAARTAPVGRSKPGAGTPSSTNVSFFGQVAGPNQAQAGGLPPDGDIATSAEWMVQVVNDLVTMYNWNTNAFKQVSLATLFQDSNNVLFDPRVIHDPYWDRFAVLADTCNPCSGAATHSFFALAISQTNDPTGSWWIYGVPLSTNTGDFADFPQLGMDLNSLIFTSNVFAASNTVATKTFSIAKAYLYNGIGASYLIFGGSSCTVAPPYVLDNSATAYVLAFCPGDNKVSIGSLTNTGLSASSLHWDNTVTVAKIGIPPNAQQPGTSYALDTGDNRFENRSLQVGDRILNTATINLDGLFPAPAWYNFNISANPHTLVSSNVWYASNSSYDWHPSINANRVGGTGSLGEIFTTWMSTDVQNNVNVQLRAGGGVGDSPPTGVTGVPVYTSPLPLTNQTDSKGIHRTGDYSYIALYPAAALGCSAHEIGILTGEAAAGTAGQWSTRIGIVKHC
jgi:hypothetical protein